MHKALRLYGVNDVMNKTVIGLLSGVIFGSWSAAMMLPMEFEDKTVALAGAFASRFAIGVIIGLLDRPSWQNGALVGALVSLPDAIITRSWVPIMSLGTLGGGLIGWATKRWGA